VSAVCLSFHADWRCRHSGACCRAGWAIPVEADRFERIRAHVGPQRGAHLFVTGGPLPDGAAAVLASGADGACRFHEGQRCAIHRDLGEDALPSACQQFPRIALTDARGTFVRLSHYCPTAASLLMQTSTFTTVPAPATIALNGRVEGLDARAVLPPLLRSGLLTDVDGYAIWERLGVETLASGTLTASEAVAVIDAATLVTLEWRPADIPLADAVRNAFASAHPIAPSIDLQRDLVGFACATSSIPYGLRAPTVPRGIEAVWTHANSELDEHDAALRAWLASHLFGNWVAYSANGLSTVVEYLRVCLAVLRVELARECVRQTRRPTDQRMLEAIRQSDHILHHLAEVPALTRSIELAGLNACATDVQARRPEASGGGKRTR
jgi:hypothetical protein